MKFFKWTHEFKVGVLIFCGALLTLGFAWLIGTSNPFKSTITFFVTYNFAGGIEVGSPVRVSGIKVGKVEKIEFFVTENFQDNTRDKFNLPGTSPQKKQEIVTPLRFKVSIAKDAAEGVRQDSEFYINLAGIIGERYLEITPGTVSSVKIKDGDVLRGIDPPRVDQMISQSFNLAGKIKDVIQNNEADITRSIKLLYEMSASINRTLGSLEKSKLFESGTGNVSELVHNLIEISRDVKHLTSKTRTDEGKRTLELLYKLLWRLEPLDQEAIRAFFQKEGIKAKLF